MWLPGWSKWGVERDLLIFCWNSAIWTRLTANVAFFMTQNILCTVSRMLACAFCPLPSEEKEQIDFCVYPVYISIYIGMTLICVPGFFWTSWRIFTKLMYVYTIKSWLSLYDLDLFFKVTLGLKLPNLRKIMIVSAKSPKLVNELWMNLYECNLGKKTYFVTLTSFHKVTKWLKLQNLSKYNTVKDWPCYIC